MGETATQRVIVYVDGFNFYHGMKDKGWRKYYWLNIVGFFEKFMKPGQELVEVKYFSAPSLGKDKNKRQNTFFEANKTFAKFILILGKYYSKTVVCSSCKFSFSKHEEKRTDVNIATQLLLDVVKGRNDVSILVTADSDLIPPILALKELNPKHKIIVFFPPQRHSNDLKYNSSATIDLDRYETRFIQNQLPNDVTLVNGKVLQKPQHWNGK